MLFKLPNSKYKEKYKFCPFSVDLFGQMKMMLTVHGSEINATVKYNNELQYT